MSVVKPESESDRFFRQALLGLIGLKIRSGTSVEELNSLVAQCVKSASDETNGVSFEKGLDIHRLGSVLRTWHKETKYLTSDGNPAPLRMQGRNGLHELISGYYEKRKVPAVVSALRRARLIKRAGATRWLPTADHAQISSNSQEILDHVSEGVARFLETVLNNISVRDEADLLFEKSCKVRKLPMRHAKAYRRFVRQQAIMFLTAIDDWLESRADQPPGAKRATKTCSAGAFTFAYLDANEIPARDRAK